MAKPMYTLQDDFELKGLWWLPDKSDIKVSGTLVFKNDRRITLELLGAFVGITSFKLNDFLKPQIILGVTNNGLLCTLLKNREIRRNLSFPGVHTSSFECDYLFIGKLFEDSEDICFDSVLVNLTYLENWLTMSPFLIEVPVEEENRELKLLHKDPPEFTAVVEGQGFKIESIHELNMRGDLIRDAHWKSRAYLKILPDDQKEFKWYCEKIDELCDLMTLLVGEACYILHLRALYKKTRDVSIKNDKEMIEIFFSQKKWITKIDMQSHEMIMPFPKIEENISDVLSRYFEKAEKLKSVFDLFFGTFYNPNLYLQFQFLSLVQAIESYHRVTKGGKYLSDEEWAPYRDNLISNIASELESGHKDSLKSRIRYGNEFSLRKRFSELLTMLSKEALTNLSPSSNYFPGIIVDTRNYFTHYDKELEDHSLSGSDLYWANQRLRFLLTILLLMELGIEENYIFDSFRNNENFRQIPK